MSTSQVALVTGGAQGIGYAIALRLAEDGLDVAVNDIEAKADKLEAVVLEIQAKGRRAVAVPADVRSEDAVKAMIEKTVEVLGGLDVMVANAGIGALKPLVECTGEDWDGLMDINGKGVFLCYRYAASQMIKQGRGGRIIGASSMLGKRGLLNSSMYSATKFAVRALTQVAAQELAPHNIQVNAYAPGIILTPMVATPRDYEGPGSGLAKALGLPPHTPRNQPEVVASIVSYLSKPESFFITGQTISVDGGIIFD